MNPSDVSQEVVQLIPLLMRKLHSNMRCNSDNMMSAHFRLLTILQRRSRTMSELAEMQSVSPATLSNSVSILVEKGWLRRVPSPDDRRIVRVEATELGRKKLVDIDHHLHENIQKSLDSLTPDELEQVGNGLAILRRLLTSEFQHKAEHSTECGEEHVHPQPEF